MPSKVKRGLTKIKGRNSKLLVIIFVLIFAGIGAALLLPSFAASPPAAAGYYQTIGGNAGSNNFSNFPSEASCASQVKARNNPWEPRPVNNKPNQVGIIPNQKIYTSTELAAYHSFWSNDKYFSRVTGNFSGTTDQIIQWASCKWGLEDNYFRTEGIQETNWNQTATGDINNGACPTTEAVYVNGSCAASYGFIQDKWQYHKEAWPFFKNSTAFELDYALAQDRKCFDSNVTKGTAFDVIKGCMAAWYAGDPWNNQNGQNYANLFASNYSKRPWLTWADQSGSNGDTTAPSVSLTAPTSGSTLSGTVSVTANASDNVGVRQVDFLIDGSLLSSDTTSPYSYSWDTTKVANGSHSVQARAFDTSNNSTNSSTATVNIQNAPPPPPANQPPSVPTGVTATANAYNKVTVNWTASTDTSGTLANYTIWRSTTGAAAVKIGQVSAPTTSFVDTTVSAQTTYAYQVQAGDTLNIQSALSTAASVTTPAAPQQTNPTVNITSPSNGQTVSGNVNVTATAAAQVSVAKVEFYIDGVLANTDATSPYGFTWNAGSVANGNHIISAKVYDNVNNTGVNQINVTVQNPDVLAPSVPGGVTATLSGTTSVAVNWSASTDNVGVTGYYVSRSINGGVPTTLVQVSGSTLSYTDTTVVAGNIYGYYISAFDAAGNVSAVSTAATVSVNPPPPPSGGDVTPPTAPSALAATAVSTSQINIKWVGSTDNIGVTGYDVYRNGARVTTVLPSDPAPYACPVPHPTIQQQASAPASGTTTYTCTQRLQWLLDKVSGATLSIDGWDGPNTNAAVVNYQQKNGLTANGVVDSTTWNKLESSIPITFGDSGLSAGTSYIYYIVAHDSAGNNSAPSATATATTLAPVSNGNVTGTITATNDNNPYNCPTHPTLSYVSSAPASGTTQYICTQRVQAFLNSINNAGLKVDGWFGSNTDRAVRNYQTRFGLLVDGVVGPNTWGSLETQGSTTAPASGAQITYTSGGSQHIVSADSTGKYNVTGIPAATYSFVYSLQNYSSQSISITVTGGQTTTKNVTLQHL